MNEKDIDDLIDYVMEYANKQYSDDFPISHIEDWIRDFFKNNQPERSKREDLKEFVYRPEKYDGPIAMDNKPSKECDEYHKNSTIQINLRCGALNPDNK